MILKIDGEDYVVSTSLGVAYDIETTKRKKISDIVTGDVDIKAIIDILYFGFKVKNKNVTYKQFEEMILNAEDMSYMKLQKEFSVFANLIISTDKTEVEVREMVEEIYNNKKEEIEKQLTDENEKN